MNRNLEKELEEARADADALFRANAKKQASGETIGIGYYHMDEHVGAICVAAELRALRLTIEVAHQPAPEPALRTISRRELRTAFMEQMPPDGEEIHYADLLSKLEAVGLIPGGNDAKNTLLSALNRHPEVENCESRSGMYRRRVAF